MLLAALCAIPLGSPRTGSAGEPPPPPPPVTPKISFDDQIRPVLREFCFRCHGAEVKKGGLDLERFADEKSVIDGYDLWKRVVERVENKSMPPGGTAHPEDAQRTLVAEWYKGIEPDAGDCDKVATDDNQSFYQGVVMSRRLNRNEYENTVRDLFGTAVPLAELFPADGSGGEGFSNNGSTLFTSTIQIEKYMDAAGLILESLPESRLNEIVRVRPGEGIPPREAARRNLTPLAARAWRRPVASSDLEAPLRAFDRAWWRGDTFEDSVRLAIKVILISPEFVFLVEPEPELEGIYPLGPYPLASRLSYFLWASMPDAELFARAADGTLTDPEVIRAQVRRMLADPKARGLGEEFARQWLGIEALNGAVRPDPERFPDFDDELAALMNDEAVSFFEDIVRNDRSLLDLISSEHVFVNQRLAEHYGMTGVEGRELRRVQVADASRGGVLGLGAVLTVTSHPLRTSPVLRGKWVLEQILGDRIPPPPPEVEPLPEDDRDLRGLTLRERLVAHRENPECASCHQRMDPIGFGMENFDPVGRWRAEINGAPVDSSGELTSGEKFSGPAELKPIILAQKGKFVRHLTRKMLGYSLGRPLTRFDNCVIDGTAAALAENDYRSSMMFEQIALSYPFRHRYAKK